MAETLLGRRGAGRDTRIGVQREVPRGYMALASHRGSCKHGCGDQCSRQKFELGHSISPLGLRVWLPASPVGLASHRADEMASLFRINQETGQAIGLFRRTSLAVIATSIDDLTFT
jgi:hypothetical protein